MHLVTKVESMGYILVMFKCIKYVVHESNNFNFYFCVIKVK